MIQNLHTHTTFCDGANTAEQMVLKAISLGFKALGFSGHSPIDIHNDWTMQSLLPYIIEISRLKQLYKNKIEIFCGLECECIFPIDVESFDYTISSVHMMRKNDVILSVDESKTIQIQDIENHYKNANEYAKEYFDLVVKASKKGDILGHFDLITKFNKDNDIFDEMSKDYLDIASKALLECKKSDIIFEINTGAMQRGYMDRFYPAPYLLDMLLDSKIIITTDAHSVDGLDFYYDQTVKILKSFGFKNKMILTKNGFEEISL